MAAADSRQILTAAANCSAVAGVQINCRSDAVDAMFARVALRQR